MEPKYFFEVFSELKIRDELKKIYDDVLVRRVVNNRNKNLIRIYIESGRLIHKKDIYEMDSVIKKMFNNAVSIRIIEHFTLSSQYNSENLYKMYEDSILTEIREYSKVEYSLLKKAEIAFNEDVMMITFKENWISEEKSKELKNILFKIFNERCGVPTEIRFEFVQEEESKFEKMKELKMQKEVEAILSGIRGAEDKKEKETHKEDKNESKDNEQTKEVAAKKSEEGKDFKKKSDSGFVRSVRRSDNPDVIYGRDFDGQSMEMSEIQGEMGEVICRGKIMYIDERPIRDERTIFSVAFTDYTDSIVFKLFLKNENLPEIKEKIKPGACIKVKAMTTVDKFDNDLILNSVAGIIKIPDFSVKRNDTGVEKRVELHCHTKLSDMDGVASAMELISRAKEWGHTAMAITDHGVVQGFTEAWHALQKLEGKYGFKEKFDFKMIYGVEAYLVVDLMEVVSNS